MPSFKVVAVNVSTIFQMNLDENELLCATGGADYTLLQILADSIPFRFQLLNQADFDYGSINKNNEWTGMIAKLMKGEADMALGWVANTHVRHQVVDFSFPYLVDSSVFFTAAPGVRYGELPFLEPFQVLVWYLLLLSLPFSAAMVCLLSEGKKKKYQFIRGWVHESNRLLALFLSQDGTLVGTYDCYKRGSVRAFMYLWSISKLVLVFSYTSTLLAVLMVPQMESPLKDVRELRDAVASGRYQFGTFKGTSHMGNLMEADSGVLKELGDHIRRHPENILQGFDNGVARVEGGKFAVLVMRLHLVLTASRIGLHRFYISRDSIGFNLVSVAFKKGFNQMEKVNRIIHRISESGIYSKQIQDMIYRSKLKAPPEKPTDSKRSLSFEDMQTAVQLLYIGHFISACCLVLEICFYKYQQRVVKSLNKYSSKCAVMTADKNM